MVTKSTNGIAVNVEVFYLEHQSNPVVTDYVYAYRVTIINTSDRTVKLMRRHWRIADSNGDVRMVEGEGVVGQQPTLQPNEQYQYTSGCNLKTDLGTMEGSYTMKDLFTTNKFEIAIPKFILESPFRLN